MYGLGTDAIYTLSLHDALPICGRLHPAVGTGRPRPPLGGLTGSSVLLFRPGHRNSSRTDQFSAFSASRLKDRKSTRLNSSHVKISYAVFCLKKKNKTK